jgi:YHS domain-containing protein
MKATKSRRILTVALAAGLLLGAVPALAAAPQNLSRAGIAAGGYDVVAYFTDGAAVEGSDAHVHEWQGATYRFASKEHRDLFAADPGKYAPQYGGYCAYAMSRGDKAKIDPEVFTVEDGKLYLNYSFKIRAKWDEERADYIRKADGHWKKLAGN